jgi:hypothetical protein
MEAEEEAVGDGAEAGKGVNNEGYQKGVALIQCTNYHFAIYKSTGGAEDARATKFCLFCFLKVFGEQQLLRRAKGETTRTLGQG